MVTRMNYWMALNHIQNNIKSCRTVEQKEVVRKMIANTYHHFSVDQHKRTYKGGEFESSQFDGWMPEYLATLDMWDKQPIKPYDLLDENKFTLKTKPRKKRIKREIVLDKDLDTCDNGITKSGQTTEN